MRRSISVVIGLVILLTPGLASPACSSLQRVSLQLQWVTQAQFAGYYVALDKGWYLDEGIDMTIKPGGPDSSPVDLVSSGKSDFGTGFLSDLCVAVGAGKPVISIAQIQQNNGMLLIAKKSSGIKEPQDLIGKRVGIWLGSWDAQFKALMANEGINLDSINIISQGLSMEPFLNGEIDVASAMTYAEYQLESVQTIELNIIDYADYGLGFPGDVLFAASRTVKQNPTLCTHMVQASLKGWQYAIEHPEEATDIVMKYAKNGELNRNEQSLMMNQISKLVKTTGRDIGFTDRTTVKQVLYILRQNVLKSPLQPEDVYTNNFWNQAVVKGS
jgi:NitT/TauT family transport system substrate-binding protein